MRASRLAGVLFTFVAFAAEAQSQPAHAFAEHLFPPELVMQHQRDIGLTDAQRQHITELIQETQSQMVQLQWEMADAKQALNEHVGSERVDEAGALTAADHLMKIENRIKHEHLKLLIGIKNVLDPEQQQQLRALRGKMSHKRLGQARLQ